MSVLDAKQTKDCKDKLTELVRNKGFREAIQTIDGHIQNGLPTTKEGMLKLLNAFYFVEFWLTVGIPAIRPLAYYMEDEEVEETPKDRVTMNGC